MVIVLIFHVSKDRREALRRLLQTMLITYLQLLDTLVKPPPSVRPPTPPPSVDDVVPPAPANPEDEVTTSQRLAQHIHTTSINMHHLCNELRPIQVWPCAYLYLSDINIDHLCKNAQAREALQNMMREQIDRRKRRTTELKS